MNELKKYRQNRCAEIQCDSGRYYLVEDVDPIIAEIKKEREQRCDILKSHVHISKDEFKELATFAMCNDNHDQQADTDKVRSVLDQIAIGCLGFDDWIQAYHEL